MAGIGKALAVTKAPQSEQAAIAVSLIEIPPFPAVALKTLQLISNASSHLSKISEMLSADPVLSGEVLRVVNSPFFGIRTEVTSVLQATVLLGLERIRGLVVTIGMRAYLGESLTVPALRSCWRHSLACAIIAEDLAKGSSKDKDIAYTAGIIHDIGRLGLAVAYRKQYAALLQEADEKSCDLLASEREVFGIDHCEAGRSLVLRWKLPQEFAVVTSRHHEASSGGTFDLLAIIRVSCMMADALGFQVARSPQRQDYAELLRGIPKDNRPSTGPEELAFLIANKINAVETF